MYVSWFAVPILKLLVNKLREIGDILKHYEI
jgi:hypothetical protein